MQTLTRRFLANAYIVGVPTILGYFVTESWEGTLSYTFGAVVGTCAYEIWKRRRS